ncbi:TetR family transcriptional regulator [Actinacidiphila sp. DG2A-62]|uniref:TetR/AcrR family transcriptional regulator n=1 Tax=Actinacidiphila sp. DG2A-62 TaxID=3108821 RepID=UPI002DBE5372|nr:TetR family transcriptional regulator [Actinacidiphila sp. DG2A-62]MEC3998426.1 TetR family transcriptional regulator [Actinacidiphila sp. DG2A-62]
MGRWEPNARGRLREAAMELFEERGYEETTVVEIARRAGLTDRTFFRHFADKPEVLFDGSDVLREVFVAGIAGARAEDPPMAVMASMLLGIAPRLQADRERARRRHAIISGTPELLERELMKLARLAEVAGDALRRRGVPDPTAALVAETGIAVFRTAFARWIGPDEKAADLDAVMRETLAELAALTRPLTPAAS